MGGKAAALEAEAAAGKAGPPWGRLRGAANTAGAPKRGEIPQTEGAEPPPARLSFGCVICHPSPSRRISRRGSPGPPRAPA